jgi:uncharacterized protein (DUF486 family)
VWTIPVRRIAGKGERQRGRWKREIRGFQMIPLQAGLPCGRARVKARGMTGFKTIVLLTLSNVFMTFAWYAHLRDLREKPWIIAALISWGIAFFEYLIQVPANRTGYQVFNLGQLKILQEVITLSVFVPFAVFFMKEKITWNYLGAAVCLAGAVFFIFRK